MKTATPCLFRYDQEVVVDELIVSKINHSCVESILLDRGDRADDGLCSRSSDPGYQQPNTGSYGQQHANAGKHGRRVRNNAAAGDFFATQDSFHTGRLPAGGSTSWPGRGAECERWGKCTSRAI